MSTLARPPDQNLEREVHRLARLVTPTKPEVSVWHHVDQALTQHWESPLVRVLRFLTKQALAETEISNTEVTSVQYIDLTEDRLQALLHCA